MDAAKEHIHLSMYIWLTDDNGLKVVDALKRAASRGVTCRAMADGLGSRAMIESPHWQDMRSSGVRVGVALQIGNPLLRPFHGRIDLRNHRKIVVIDNSITYAAARTARTIDEAGWTIPSARRDRSLCNVLETGLYDTN